MASGTQPPRPPSSPRPRPPSSDPRPESGEPARRDPNPLRSASFALALCVLVAPRALAQDVGDDGPQASEASEEDRIVLAEILPALEGSELGELPIGPAPAPGTERRVTRAEVLRALARAGRDPRGLAIPRSVQVRRTLRALDARGIDALIRPALARALAPCELVEWRGPARLEIGATTPTIEADIAPPLRAEGSVSGIVRVAEAGREQRIAVRAIVRCPEPAVAAGDRIRVVVRVGPVLASAVGVARQPGRVGDVIRVTNEATRATLLARVVDDETVEVVR